MSDPDFNLLVALNILLSEASIAGVARRLNLSTSAMSRALSRLRDVIEDPILMRAGRNMVLAPWIEAAWDCVRHAVHRTRATLQPSTETFYVRSLARLFTIKANDGFVVAFGPAFIAAVVDAVSDVCIRFVPKPKKTSRYLRKGLADLGIGVQSNMGPEIRLRRPFGDRFIGIVRRGHPLAKQTEAGMGDYVTWDYVITSSGSASHGSVGDTLAELGTKRKIASVVSGFPTALSVALESDLITVIPALYLLDQQVADQVHIFELPFKSRHVTVSQMWHLRMERDLGYRWLRE